MLLIFAFLSFISFTSLAHARPCAETADKEITAFRNIRFGKNPVGKLRFAAPRYPDPIKDNSQIQDSSYGSSCIQAAIDIDEEMSPEPFTNSSTKQSEDCLFLDIYVPTWLLEEGSDESLPVVVWIYGGAYIFGGILDATQTGVIWVTGNYRLGAYGFLAGSTMEAEGQPNAGLYDQRLLLDFVHKYIGLVRGDKDAVSVFGLSAGAGSILHHLAAFGGKDAPPKFQRAALWSTAFQWAYDRKQTLQNTFLDFAYESKCPRAASKALSCLRTYSADGQRLRDANRRIISRQLKLGLFPFGPAVDGKLVPDLPANLLAKGNHHKNISSMILSHDWDEASLFLAKWVDTKEQFTQFLNLAFPGDSLGAIRTKIEEKYPSKVFDFNQTLRMRQVLRDSTFVCNKYQLYKAYKNTTGVYTARYEIPPALHGSDLLAIVYNQRFDLSRVLKSFLPKVPEWMLQFLENIFNGMAPVYKRYLAGFAQFGDPNSHVYNNGVWWPKAHDDGDEITNSPRIGFFTPKIFSTGQDQQTSATSCDFWNEVAQEISRINAFTVASRPCDYGLSIQGVEL